MIFNQICVPVITAPSAYTQSNAHMEQSPIDVAFQIAHTQITSLPAYYPLTIILATAPHIVDTVILFLFCISPFRVK